MNPLILNAAVLPLFATIFYPDAFRDRNTGEFFGFFNLKAIIYFVSIFAVELVLVSDEFGLNLTTLLRVTLISLLPFLGGVAFTFYSHKRNFGVSLDVSRKKGRD